MNYPSIKEYKEAILFAEDNFEQLKNLRPVLEDDGSPVMTSGNFAVVFKMKDEQTGKLHAVKCFLREQEGRAEAYRQIAEELEYVSSTFLTPIKYLEKELFVDTNAGEESEFPVLLMDWVEGQTLDKYIREHIDDQYELSLLAYQFSRLAMWLMPQPFAHGDLKPDNILVKEDGTLVLVDYDGMYVPAMKGQKARELGSPDFRHPGRTEEVFDDHIDDFSLASILLSLKAIALQPSLLEEYGASDRLLFSEKDYRNLSDSKVMDALKPLMQDAELASLYSLYILALSQKNLSQVSFRLFNLSRPDRSQYAEENLSTEVTEEDLANAFESFDILYSINKKKILRLINSNDEEDDGCFYDSFTVVTEPDAEIICDNAFQNSSMTSITIPKSCKSIGKNAFSGCSKLKYIHIPNDVTYIGRHAFGRCSSLKSIAIPDGIVTLPDSTFESCKSLEWVINSNNLQSIGSATFKNCTSLKAIYFPQSIRKIGRNVFAGCSSLKSIFIPRGSLEKFEQLLKEYSDKLVEIEQEDLSTIVTENDFSTGFRDYGESCDVIYSPDGSRLLKIANADNIFYFGIWIRKGTKVICNNAFASCYYLSYIDIPDSVSILGDSLFYKCNSLKSVTIPSSVTKMCGNPFVGYYNGAISCLSNNFQIDDAFLFDRNKDNIISYIGQREKKHSGIELNVIIPKGVKHIGVSAFRERHITSIELPDSLISIESYAFCGCEMLQTVVFPNNLKSIGDGAFSGCSFLKNIEMPIGMEWIGSNAFAGCDRLVSVIFPETIKHIGNNPFSYCENIIDIISHSSNFCIEGRALYDNNKELLISYFGEDDHFDIKQGTTQIGEDAFAGCKSLKSIKLPNSITNIGQKAFRFCTALEEINIPYGIKEIGDETFNTCESLKSIFLPDGILHIGKSAFGQCKSLRSIFLPDGIKTIDDFAFSMCKKLVFINIPKGIKSIGENAFYGCGSLKTVHAVEIVSTAVTDEDINNALTDEYGGKYSKDGKRFLKFDDEHTYPIHHCGYIIKDGVEVVCDYAFADCQRLKMIKLPPTVTAIGDSAFADCADLEILDLPQKLTSIGGAAFNRCFSMKSISIPGKVVHLGSNPFAESGVSAIISHSPYFVTDENALYDKDKTLLITLFKNVSKYTIPSSVISIGDYSCRECHDLETITCQDGLIYIGKYAFSDSALSMITLPNSLNYIGECAFANTNIPSIYLPPNITIIDEDAFVNCEYCHSFIIEKGTRNKFERLLSNPQKALVEVNYAERNELIITQRSLSSEEIASLKSAVVISSQNILMVKFDFVDGGYTELPLDEKSKLSDGDLIDIKKAKIVRYCCNGKVDIIKVLE
jgi:serine/threonine protein kinase